MVQNRIEKAMKKKKKRSTEELCALEKMNASGIIEQKLQQRRQDLKNRLRQDTLCKH